MDMSLQVCIVQKKDDGSMYAMKYMNKNQCIRKDAIKNVMREIEILTSLDHPFLVNLWFSFQVTKKQFNSSKSEAIHFHSLFFLFLATLLRKSITNHPLKSDSCLSFSFYQLFKIRNACTAKYS